MIYLYVLAQWAVLLLWLPLRAVVWVGLVLARAASASGDALVRPIYWGVVQSRRRRFGEQLWQEGDARIGIWPPCQTCGENVPPGRHAGDCEALKPVVTFDDPLESLRKLRDDWDGEGAPAPSELATSVAGIVLRSLPSDLRVAEVDADALGGVAIWLAPAAGPAPRGRWVTIICRNSGKVSLLLDDRAGKLETLPLETIPVESVEDALSAASRFLSGSLHEVPLLDRQIDQIYGELRDIAEKVSTTPVDEDRYRDLLGQLRALEVEDARRVRAQFMTLDPLKPGEVAAALSDASRDRPEERRQWLASTDLHLRDAAGATVLARRLADLPDWPEVTPSVVRLGERHYRIESITTGEVCGNEVIDGLRDYERGDRLFEMRDG